MTHYRSLLSAAAVFAVTPLLNAQAPQPPAAAAKPETVKPAEVAPSGIAADFEKLGERFMQKRRAGKTAVADFEAEFKELDAMIDRYKEKKDEDTAAVALMRAMLYLQLFEDVERAELNLKKVPEDFAGTEAATKATELLAMVPRMKQMTEAKKLNAALVPGKAFPDFDEKDMDGNPVSLAKLRGKIVLVDFWATWCGPCIGELPNVLAAYEKYHSKGFEIVGISLDEDRDALVDLTKDKKMSWPQIFDGKGWQSKLAGQYGIRSIPATFLLNAKGEIIARDLRGAELAAELEKLLGK